MPWQGLIVRDSKIIFSNTAVSVTSLSPSLSPLCLHPPAHQLPPVNLEIIQEEAN